MHICTEISHKILLVSLYNNLHHRVQLTNLKVKMNLTKLMPNVLYGAETWPLKKLKNTGLQCLREKYSEKCMGRTLMFWQTNGGNYTTINCNSFLVTNILSANILKEIEKRRLIWAGYSRRKHESLIRKVIEDIPRETSWKNIRLRWGISR